MLAARLPLTPGQLLGLLSVPVEAHQYEEVPKALSAVPYLSFLPEPPIPALENQHVGASTTCNCGILKGSCEAAKLKQAWPARREARAGSLQEQCERQTSDPALCRLPEQHPAFQFGRT